MPPGQTSSKLGSGASVVGVTTTVDELVLGDVSADVDVV